MLKAYLNKDIKIIKVSGDDAKVYLNNIITNVPLLKQIDILNVNEKKLTKYLIELYLYLFNTDNENYNDKNFINEKKLIILRKFCGNKNIKFYIINDIKLAFRYKADGLIISSNNKRPIYNFNKQIVKIGVAHTQKEYHEKEQQKCDYIFLSPIFSNKKYSANKILGILNVVR